jgi:uncharacterized membrane protein
MLAEQGANLSATKNNRAATPLLWLSVLTIGLAAGLFFGFSVLVMPGLAQVDDHSFVFAMQDINSVANSSGGFALAFFGAFVFPAVAAIVFWRMSRKVTARWIIIALVFYVIGLIITMAGNIPLNDAIAAFGDPDKITDFAGARHAFNESSWSMLNLLRTIACSLGLLAMVGAAVQHGRDQRAVGR